jgi:hypothetical protein
MLPFTTGETFLRKRSFKNAIYKYGRTCVVAVVNT